MKRRDFLITGLAAAPAALTIPFVARSKELVSGDGPMTATEIGLRSRYPAHTFSRFPQLQFLATMPSQPVGIVNYRDMIIVACQRGEIVQVTPYDQIR